ncbi:hypothetical protein ACU6U9_02460 [Pseudomonas sp. HK3]|jgi:hypothetical protein
MKSIKIAWQNIKREFDFKQLLITALKKKRTYFIVSSLLGVLGLPLSPDALITVAEAATYVSELASELAAVEVVDATGG